MNGIIFAKVKLFEWREKRNVRKLFYSNKRFKELDQALLKSYRYINPYLVSKRYFVNKCASDIHVYGETPLTTMDTIARECDISSSDVILEMGAGRGRISLFLAEFIGAKVLAYEMIPEFVEKMVPSPNLEMRIGDMFTADFSKVTIIYLYGTMLKDEEIMQLCKKIPKGVKIITVSYSLKKYNDHYQINHKFLGKFPWGQTEVYLNERAF